MAIVVGTNSYVTEAELATYASDRGITISGTANELLIKAMDWLETQYYKGVPYEDGQALQFPRSWYDIYFDDAGVVPDRIKTCQMQAAVYIDGGADLNPSVSQAVKLERLEGAVTREYQDSSTPYTTYPYLAKLLSPYLASGIGQFTVDRA